MGRAEPERIAPIVERAYVPVVFSTRVIRVDRIGDNLLLTFGFDTVDEGGRPIVEIVAKVLRPISTVMGTSRLVAMAHVDYLPVH
jgi:hypothetical protein